MRADKPRRARLLERPRPPPPPQTISRKQITKRPMKRDQRPARHLRQLRPETLRPTPTTAPHKRLSARAAPPPGRAATRSMPRRWSAPSAAPTPDRARHADRRRRDDDDRHRHTRAVRSGQAAGTASRASPPLAASAVPSPPISTPIHPCPAPAATQGQRASPGAPSPASHQRNGDPHRAAPDRRHQSQAPPPPGQNHKQEKSSPRPLATPPAAGRCASAQQESEDQQTRPSSWLRLGNPRRLTRLRFQFGTSFPFVHRFFHVTLDTCAPAGSVT
jgi:hypothetical protein